VSIVVINFEVKPPHPLQPIRLHSSPHACMMAWCDLRFGPQV